MAAGGKGKAFVPDLEVGQAREKGQQVNLDESSKFTQASASAAEVVGMCRQRYDQMGAREGPRGKSG